MMQYIYHYAIYAIFVMHMLFILAACNQNSAKKTISKTRGEIEQSPEIINEMAAESFFITNEAYTLPSCEQQPYVSPPITGDLEEWRGELEQIKSQILNQIHGVGLTQDFAVQLALINNPNLLAFYENLEIGYANLLEAGLRKNPVFRSKIRFPDDASLGPESEFETTTNFLDFFLIPFRENAALAELYVIESQLGQEVLDLAKVVKINWILVKTLTMEINQELKRIELKQIAWDLGQLQKQAGNVGNTSVRNFKLDYERSKNKLNVRLADLEIAKEKLNRSLGLSGPDTCFPLAGELFSKNNSVLPQLFDMERAAVENRPDVEALRRQIFALAEKAKLKDPWTYSNLVIGQSLKNNPDGSSLFGPIVQLEAPVYNFGQAEREKSHALIEQAQKKLLAKAIDVCSQVREFFDTMTIYQSQLENIEKEILPDFEKQIADAIVKLNVMAFSIFDLFELKNRQIDAMIDHIHALRLYNVAKIELLHAMGGDFAIVGGKK